MTYAAVHVKDKRIDIRMTEELLARVDARRLELGQSRTVFIERALESALGGGQLPAAGQPVGKQDPAPSRAPAASSAKKPAVGGLPSIAPRHWGGS